ncbi:MAG: DNA methylase [Clostridia bacterium]|nr:DNA methylase [Clostridia bacterium]
MQVYAAIDFKSFYASVECAARGLDPLTTNLVVADESRTSKTICLAVSPSLKALGLPGRCRLYEVEEAVRAYESRTGTRLPYVIARPQMHLYMEESARIYREVYLKYISEEDIHVYSIDEVFLDLTRYLKLYNQSPHDLVRTIIRAILDVSGITATAGIGTNLYLAKVAMDIVAKHIPADTDGVRIAALTEKSYRELWAHMPLTDFWRIGKKTADRLQRYGLWTMGDIARFSLEHEDTLYREFGVKAELLIDHAWGREPCTIADIRRFRPQDHSLTAGQVLACAYTPDRALTVVEEMVDQLVLDLVSQDLVADALSLYIGYDADSTASDLVDDFYGRSVPRPASGSIPITNAEGNRIYSSSSRDFLRACRTLYQRIVSPHLMVRRMYIAALHAMPRSEAAVPQYEQLSLFSDAETQARDEEARSREHKLQEALLHVREKYGKNTVLKGISLKEEATGRDRNQQIGGHRAGS